MARPHKEIDTDNFKKLCGMQCTLSEIAGFFDCCEDTIENWGKRALKQSFSDAYKKYSASGKISLRRAQFRLAEKNPRWRSGSGSNTSGRGTKTSGHKQSPRTECWKPY